MVDFIAFTTKNLKQKAFFYKKPFTGIHISKPYRSTAKSNLHPVPGSFRIVNLYDSLIEGIFYYWSDTAGTDKKGAAGADPRPLPAASQQGKHSSAVR
jgi:hypothetical protein